MSKELIKTNTQCFVINFLEYLKGHQPNEAISYWNAVGRQLFTHLLEGNGEEIPFVAEQEDENQRLLKIIEIYSHLNSLYLRTWRLDDSYVLVDFIRDFAVVLSKVPGVETNFKYSSRHGIIYPAFSTSLLLSPVGTSLNSEVSFEILTDKLLDKVRTQPVIEYNDYWNECVEALVMWVINCYKKNGLEPPVKTELTYLLSIGQGEQNLMGLLTIPYVIGLIPDLKHLQEPLEPLLELRGSLIKYIIELSNVTGNNGNYEVVRHSTCLGPRHSVHPKHHPQYVIWE